MEVSRSIFNMDVKDLEPFFIFFIKYGGGIETLDEEYESIWDFIGERKDRLETTLFNKNRGGIDTLDEEYESIWDPIGERKDRLEREKIELLKKIEVKHTLKFEDNAPEKKMLNDETENYKNENLQHPQPLTAKSEGIWDSPPKGELKEKLEKEQQELKDFFEERKKKFREENP